MIVSGFCRPSHISLTMFCVLCQIQSHNVSLLIYFIFLHSQKHNQTNYMELEGFDDQRLTVMPVPVPEVTYSDVKVDLR